jgi:hypothetical protein
LALKEETAELDQAGAAGRRCREVTSDWFVHRLLGTFLLVLYTALYGNTVTGWERGY